MEHWKGLPRVEVESPSQEIFKRHVGMARRDFKGLCRSASGWTW